jgi:XTP/dITP diphosphohydrolase
VTNAVSLVAECADILTPVGVSVLSLIDVGLPEPAEAGVAVLNRAAGKASVIASFSNLPSLGFAQEFRIDPLLRYGGGSGPQWTWPLPRSASREKIYAEMRKADDTLVRGGYCGPDDRGACFRCVLCLAWPDMETLVLEARTDGQLGAVDHQKIGRAADVFSDYFVPDGEERPIGFLPLAARMRYSPLRRAIGLLRDLAT